MSLTNGRRIAIVRSVLALVAVLPMLMPPGMCLCQLAACPAPTPADGSSIPSPTPAFNSAPVITSSACACHRCGHEAAAEPDAATDAPAIPDDLPHPPDHSPGPCSGDHHPDCPVLTGLSQRLAVLADIAGSEWMQPVAVAIAFAGICEDICHSHRTPDTSTASTAPLFIAHCALLI